MIYLVKTKILLIVWGLLLFIPLQLSYANNIEIFQPNFPQLNKNSDHRKKFNRLYPLGQATLNHQVKVPIYGITVQHPIDDGILKEAQSCTTQSCTFNFNLNAKDAEQLKIVIFPNIGYVLIPRQWTDIEATVGANGTASALLMSPDHKEAITLYDSAVCSGCGYPYASLYFPHLLKQSLDYEYGGIQDRHKYLTLVYPSKTTAFFSYQIPHFNNKTHGIAKYIDDGDFNFIEISVNLDKTHKSLATPILNFYLWSH